MITYMKKIYPELTPSDFEEYITPLIDGVSSLPVYCSDYIKKAELNENQELYPYHNPCMLIATNIWDSVWSAELNKYILDLQAFRKNSCEFLSQLAFSYLIRCFAEQIKTIPENYGSPQDIYKYYTHELMSSGLREFSSTYAVAWGRCNNLLKNRLNAVKDVVRLTQEHRSELEKEFGISHDSLIVSMKADGDTHNNGSAVTIITFEDGKKVVFKPRSVSSELAYMNFIQELNSFIYPKMRALRAIDYGNYGFTSFIETENKESDMFQAGRLACLMYFLNATDMHYSNILWTDEGPLPIDLETLFHPLRVRKGIPQSKKSAYRALETSVYGTGVLPLILSSKKSSGSVDVGFTGTRDENSQSPFKIFNIIDGFSSNIKVVWRKQNIDNKLSSDKALESFIYARCEQIVDGFTNLFKQIFEQKDRFVKAVLESFQNVKLRYIHNMTYRYVQLLRCLVDAEPSRNKDIAQSLLTRMGILGTSSDKNITVSECRQLWNGDIPYFSIKFDGTELFGEDKIISKVAISPKSEFLSKMEHLTQKDLTRQIELIRLAFLAKLEDPHSEGRLSFEEISAASEMEDLSAINNIQTSNIKEIIRWFSNSLIESSFDDRYSHLPKTWIGPVVRLGNPGWTPGVLGYDLYAGRVGSALALAAAGRVLSDEKATEIASGVFERSAKILEAKTFELRNVLMSGIGAFSGVSGFLWALCAASSLTGNKRWREVAVNSWSLLPGPFTVKDVDFFDMIMGPSASIIMRYHTQTDWRLDQNSVNQCISLAHAKINSNNLKTTSGLAHGFGQMLWFFGSIAQRQKSREIEELILEIDSIIRNKYTNDDGLIQTYCGEVDQVSSSWCNGLSGLLIAYYEAYKAKCLPKESVINLINQLKAIPLSCIPIICHGSLGIVEALQYVGQCFPNETSEIVSKLEGNFCSPEYIFNYFKNGKSRYPLSPGLMAGKAGALLYLCRSLDPTIKASPLSLGN